MGDKEHQRAALKRLRIESHASVCLSPNPNGIASLSPGLAEQGDTYPGSRVSESVNPEWVPAPQARSRNPFRVEPYFTKHPK